MRKDEESRGHDDLKVSVCYTTADVGQQVRRDVRVEGIFFLNLPRADRFNMVRG